MKKYILLIVMAVMVSCSDQLELYPETNLTEGNYYNTEEELSLAANDAYSNYVGSIMRMGYLICLENDSLIMYV